MRILTIGEQQVTVRATPVALLYYKQEFGRDLIGDIMAMEKIKDDPSSFDTIAFLQMVWAMAKADVFGKPFLPFVEWLSTLDGLDISDPNFIAAAMEEARDGFFRKGSAPKQKRRGDR
ncbi:hypothetical protein [Paenibacillus sp. KR2-11]|uniref:hypothetical protein n=1 Tax=Paenibacillus sp. KR2-11 TaxID=3385500 RepID=UPI0038FD3E22